jgi:hypothetical protein
MNRFLVFLLSSIFFVVPLMAQPMVTGGRVQGDGVDIEFYVGFGEMTSLSGSVLETRGGSLISGGLNTDLGELGINDGSESTMLGGKIAWRWITLLLDFRNNTVDASGTADSDIRINVDGVSFNGQQFEYLLIPVGSDYTLDAQSDWLGFGFRVTPLTVNPEGALRFTPWLHLGFQYVDTSFTIDSGNTVRLDVPGFANRVFAVQGQANGEGQLVIPEYGFGGELRYRVPEGLGEGIEIVASGTYRILSLEGSLSDIGFDDEDFDELSIDYTALDLGLDVLVPVTDVVKVMAGIFTEQVESNVDLDSKPSLGQVRRSVDGDFTLTGFRIGVQF